jgi:hypothetical protein
LVDVSGEGVSLVVLKLSDVTVTVDLDGGSDHLPDDLRRSCLAFTCRFEGCRVCFVSAHPRSVSAMGAFVHRGKRPCPKILPGLVFSLVSDAA